MARRKYGVSRDKIRLRKGRLEDVKATVEYIEKGVDIDKKLKDFYFELLKTKLREFRSKEENIGKPFTSSEKILKRKRVPDTAAKILARAFEDKYFNELLCTGKSVCFREVKKKAKESLRKPLTRKEKIQDELGIAESRIKMYDKIKTSLQKTLREGERKHLSTGITYVKWPEIKKFDIILRADLGSLIEENISIGHAQYVLRELKQRKQQLNEKIARLTEELAKPKKKA